MWERNQDGFSRGILNNYSSSPNGPESIAHEAEGRMGYLLRGHEGESNNCFGKIQLVGQKNRELKKFSLLKLDFIPFCR